MSKILVLGGYGNFGKRITLALAKKNIPVIISGRNKNKAEKLEWEIKQNHPNAKIDIAVFDVNNDLKNQLSTLNPSIVINTCGPFQTKDYSVALNCIESKIHYIDLADGREFVNNIVSLDDKAKEAGVTVISGASTVPGLSSAVLEHFKNEFNSIDSLTYGISPGQKAPRGLATTESILSYLGKPLSPTPFEKKTRHGWQDLYRQAYPELGKRWMANCDIPDMDLLPKHYSIKHIRFSAGMESAFLHLSIWCVSWLVRIGIPLNLLKHSLFLFKLSHWFDFLGTPDGGMHMLISGANKQGENIIIKWFLIAKKGDGPQIPIIPAVILSEKILQNKTNTPGARPCVGLVGLEEYLDELKGYDVKTCYEKEIR